MLKSVTVSLTFSPATEILQAWPKPGDKTFACISGEGIGLRLPAAVATELQFSRNDVVPFQPGGVASTREWIQINCADAADYEKHLALFQASLEFVKTGRVR